MTGVYVGILGLAVQLLKKLAFNIICVRKYVTVLSQFSLYPAFYPVVDAPYIIEKDLEPGTGVANTGWPVTTSFASS